VIKIEKEKKKFSGQKKKKKFPYHNPFVTIQTKLGGSLTINKEGSIKKKIIFKISYGADLFFSAATSFFEMAAAGTTEDLSVLFLVFMSFVTFRRPEDEILIFDISKEISYQRSQILLYSIQKRLRSYRLVFGCCYYHQRQEGEEGVQEEEGEVLLHFPWEQRQMRKLHHHPCSWIKMEYYQMKVGLPWDSMKLQ
jgi:hypothetical protein